MMDPGHVSSFTTALRSEAGALWCQSLWKFPAICGQKRWPAWKILSFQGSSLSEGLEKRQVLGASETVDRSLGRIISLRKRQVDAPSNGALGLRGSG